MTSILAAFSAHFVWPAVDLGDVGNISDGDVGLGHLVVVLSLPSTFLILDIINVGDVDDAVKVFFGPIGPFMSDWSKRPLDSTQHKIAIKRKVIR